MNDLVHFTPFIIIPSAAPYLSLNDLRLQWRSRGKISNDDGVGKGGGGPV